MKPYRYVSLSAIELLSLEDGHKNGAKPYFRDRCHCIILSSQGLKVTEIASIYKKDEETIRNWMNNWESRGISGLLIAKGRGQKPALSIYSEETVVIVKKKSKNNP